MSSTRRPPSSGSELALGSEPVLRRCSLLRGVNRWSGSHHPSRADPRREGATRTDTRQRATTMSGRRSSSVGQSTRLVSAGPRVRIPSPALDVGNPGFPHEPPPSPQLTGLPGLASRPAKPASGRQAIRTARPRTARCHRAVAIRECHSFSSTYPPSGVRYGASASRSAARTSGSRSPAAAPMPPADSRLPASASSSPYT